MGLGVGRMTPSKRAVRPRRVDANQGEIVAALRRMGASVQSLSGMGEGCPDLLVGWNGRNYLLEVKAAGGKRTPAEFAWHSCWQGQVNVAYSVEEAIAMVREEA